MGTHTLGEMVRWSQIQDFVTKNKIPSTKHSELTEQVNKHSFISYKF
jgi:hypothetical protein